MTNVISDLPTHCRDCWKALNCEQAVNMHADTWPVQGYADFDAADHFCGDCLPPGHNNAPLDGEELDSPSHCSNCGVPLNHTLTTEGVKYVRAAIADDDGGCCRELWPAVWADYLTT